VSAGKDDSIYKEKWFDMPTYEVKSSWKMYNVQPI